MTLEAVVFDLDGTLLDTLDDINEVVNRVFKDHGLSSRTREEVRFAVGRGVEHLVLELTEGEVIEPGILPLLSDNIRRVYLEMGSVMTRPYPGIPEVLEELAGIGVPMAVLTNKPQASAFESVARFFPCIGFVTVRGASGRHPLKPSPEASKPVLEALGCPPEMVVLIGDSDVDMDTAVNAGMVPVGVSWGFRSTRLLLEHGAERIIRSPSEIPGLLLMDHGEERRGD
ncbi:MAG: HAD family hydrolase [Candidatus Fermentibacteraceae bacterium]|nr:HAD family hydrolase [Candidatus Fermentibacteraceae bacterium]MBN2609792.1 HAD family hydrolase [Candidatus Fermentibacteraceae bacterium]